MDRTYITENDIATRYLRGQLTAEETREFEAIFMEDEELLELLELDSILSAHAGKAFETAAKEPRRGARKGYVQILCGVAAGVLLTLLVSVLQRNEEVMLDTFGIAQIEYFDELRSLSPDQIQNRKIDLARETQHLVLVIDTGSISAKLYDVVIRDENEKMVASIRNIAGSETGGIND